MKKVLLAFFLIAILLLSGCMGGITGKVVSGDNRDPRCLMEKPAENGDCGIVFGIYYDKIENTCKTLNACTIDGEVPFKLSLDNPMVTCGELCVIKK